ncbi:cystathionine gamma-lyase [Granulicella arctica]|uniref:Cystathionine gamma-lyase n=1 Tax=Granulicella arctica TaxID=940613 RepID=A0A7Y9PHX0_9BACT|nr:cystathionine gamma-lyase [Granulicella arctica]NYF79428.1 cystathionine gamma-lyase [Granulicella arctica]
MRDATKIIRATLTQAVAGEALHEGPVFAAPFHSPGDPVDAAYSYARSHNPTWTALEKAIGQMESGPGYRASALVFASGMAACTAVFGAVLRPGDVVVLPSNAYFAARVLVQEYFVQMGVTLRTAPTAGGAQAGLLEGAKLLWIESPSNPTMEVCDIAALCERAHEAGALVALDNTTATALGQLPLALGADFSVASDAKSMTGHSDLMVGHVAVRDMELMAKIDQWRTLTGGIVGPMEAWLALRSLATLPLRLERSSQNALRIAEFLTARREVSGVLYPGLPSDPGHAIAARQMKYFGAVLSFTLRDKVAAETFLSKAKLVTEATSFGGVTTTAERRARWGSDAVHEGFIRMSAGCEAVEDLIEDIEQALEATV